MYLFCTYVCVCVPVQYRCMDVCTTEFRQPLYCSSVTVHCFSFEAGSLTKTRPHWLVQPVWPASLRCPHVSSIFPALGLHPHVCHPCPGFLMWVLGLKLRSFHFLRKYLTHWAILLSQFSYATTYFCIIRISEMSSKHLSLVGLLKRKKNVCFKLLWNLGIR